MQNTRAMHRLFWLATATLSSSLIFGCTGSSGLGYWGSPFVSGGAITGPSSTASGGGSSVTTGGNDRSAVDPCTLSQERKFIRISMRNESNVHVHYFLLLVGYIHDEDGHYPAGGVCEDDVPLYESNGYTYIPDGQAAVFGNLCLIGPCVYRYHQSGRFINPATGEFASAIAPARGTGIPTYDSFFTSAGARLPVPDAIYFHNPGAGEGAALKVSWNSTNPCDPDQINGDPECSQDAFYYVNENDQPQGSQALGIGSFRRVPSEIQGTGCEALGTNTPYHQLAPNGVSAANARDNEFLRGGEIEFVFIRDNQTPPIPQLLWHVTDANGSTAHNLDPRAGIED